MLTVKHFFGWSFEVDLDTALYMLVFVCVQEDNPFQYFAPLGKAKIWQQSTELKLSRDQIVVPLFSKQVSLQRISYRCIVVRFTQATYCQRNHPELSPSVQSS